MGVDPPYLLIPPSVYPLVENFSSPPSLWIFLAANVSSEMQHFPKTLEEYAVFKRKIMLRYNQDTNY